MPQLNAFVGHSFSADDEPVVRALLALLNSVKNVMPEFEWDHAEAAEPKILSVKVREKMKGKNLFIGICTAKEQALQPAGLRTPFWLPRKLFAVERDSVETKTSDWIIQEIGYALGCNMDLILLVEEGVRPPGGLQGNLEYIPFLRNEPDKCFKKLSSMLGTLSPKPTSAVQSPAKSAAGESTDTQEDGLLLQTYLSPEPSWTAETYITRLRLSITIDEPELQRKISDAFRSSPFNQEESARVAFEAVGISQRALIYRQDWINPLQRLVTEHPEHVGPYLALGERFAAAAEYEQAAQSYELAARHSKPQERKIEFLLEAASQRANAKQLEAAEILLKSVAGLMRSNPGDEADGLARMSHVWKELGKTELFLACAERCLELAPDRTDPRFALAHKYSELGLDAEALFHYRQYLLVKNDPSAWNNLGVAASSLKLPVTAIDGYLRADKEGNTLATGNLAFTKLEAGFVDEAAQLCTRGLKLEDSHPRLLDALAKCKRAQEDETTKESKLLGATNVRREVLRAAGKASLSATPDRLHRTWQGPHCQLVATVDRAHVVMTGIYERKSGTLGSLISGPFTDNRAETVTVEYVGELHGEAFVGKVKTTTPAALAGALSLLGSDGIDCVGYLDSNGTQFVVLEGKSRYVLSALAE